MATSDEQRVSWIGEAMRLHYVAVALRWPPPPSSNDVAWREYERKLNEANAALRAHLDATQQAPRARADEPWRELFYRAALASGCLYSTFVDANEHVIQAIQRGRAALAANPQQSNESGGVETRGVSAIRDINAGEMPSSIRPHDAAVASPLSPNPQQIASPRENETG